MLGLRGSRSLFATVLSPATLIIFLFLVIFVKNNVISAVRSTYQAVCRISRLVILLDRRHCQLQIGIFFQYFPRPFRFQGHSPVRSLSSPYSLAYSSRIRNVAILISTTRHALPTHSLPASAASFAITRPSGVSARNLRVSGSSFMPRVMGM